MVSMTPGARAIGRPSYGGTGAVASPGFGKSVSTFDHRKASYNALTGQTPPTPTSAQDFELGEIVNVPGDMHGTVRFVGVVKGKPGHFLGVELDEEYAARGKNNGDVDGEQYFKPTIPGSGIFLPTHRAEKRTSSTSPALGSEVGDPNTPSHAAISKTTRTKFSPPTVSRPRFAQSVGLAARPASPQLRPRATPRPSLTRPESPLRRQPNLHPTPAPSAARQFSKSVRTGGLPPASPAPGRLSTPAKKATTVPPSRPYSRTSSRLGQHSESVSEAFNGRASVRGMPSYSHPLRSPSRLDSTRESEELETLRQQVRDKDRQLGDQASSLQDMEENLKELQSLMGTDGFSTGGADQKDAHIADLKRLLDEKEKKCTALIAEFDAHRADFRATIEVMEGSIMETDRVYEENAQRYETKIADLEAAKKNSEDFETMEDIATQLKSLEELVAELEEGLEDARRGEAEARSEVEHLRGEVERTKSELRRARDQAADPKSTHQRTGTPSSPSWGNGAAPALQPQTAHDLPSPDREPEPASALTASSGVLDRALVEPAETKGAEKETETETWCAMCEKTGHLAYECPEESY